VSNACGSSMSPISARPPSDSLETLSARRYGGLRCLLRRAQGPGRRSIACAARIRCCHGRAEAIATVTRHTLTCTIAPIFSGLSRIVPRVAWAHCLCARLMRPSVQSST